MMVNAGAIYGTAPYLSDPLPSGRRRPGEWIGRYAKWRLRASGLTAIDTFLLTHLHGDHVGYLSPEAPLSSDGIYRLRRIRRGRDRPIQRFVDRGWPDYAYPVPANIDFQKNYRAFLQAQSIAGKKVERFHPGSRDQFTLQHKSAYPTFEIRTFIANGEVWTGVGQGTSKLFPELGTLKPADYTADNPCSCAIRLRYGKFGYYTGGDLTNDTNYGRYPWRDAEYPAPKRAVRSASPSPTTTATSTPMGIGPGADDRHLHDEIVKLAWTVARDARHLGAALNLEHADECQFRLRLCPGLFEEPPLVASAVAFGNALADPLTQKAFHRLIGTNREGWKFVTKIVHLEFEPFAQLDQVGDRLRNVGKQGTHCARASQLPLRVGGEMTSGVLEIAPVPDCGEDVEDLALILRRIANAVGSQHRKVQGLGDRQGRAVSLLLLAISVGAAVRRTRWMAGRCGPCAPRHSTRLPLRPPSRPRRADLRHCR